MAALEPLQKLDEHLRSLDERSIDILRRRVFADHPETLDALAASHGVTRERIRQLESGAKRRTRAALDVQPIVRRVVNGQWAVVSVSTLLSESPDFGEQWGTVSASALRVVERLVGGFEVRDGWCAQTSVGLQVRECRKRISAHGTEPMWSPEVLDIVHPDDSDDWLEFIGAEQLFGRVFLRPISLAERAWIVLNSTRRGMPADELVAQLGVQRSVRSLKNALGVDERFVRVDRDRWELAEWGSNPYVSLHNAIERTVRDAGGPVRLSRLVREMTSTYAVTEKSVIAYASSPPLRVFAGLVELDFQNRGSHSKLPSHTKHLYRRDSGWCLRITLTRDHLRGSGFRVPSALVAAFGMDAGECLFFDSELGGQALRTTGRQPATGSIKRFLQGATVGDTCLLVFNFDNTFSFEPVDLHRSSGIQTAAALCGLKGEPTISAFALAIGASSDISASRLVELLRERGEYDIADLIRCAI